MVTSPRPAGRPRPGCCWRAAQCPRPWCAPTTRWRSGCCGSSGGPGSTCPGRVAVTGFDDIYPSQADRSAADHGQPAAARAGDQGGAPAARPHRRRHLPAAAEALPTLPAAAEALPALPAAAEVLPTHLVVRGSCGCPAGAGRLRPTMRASGSQPRQSDHAASGRQARQGTTRPGTDALRGIGAGLDRFGVVRRRIDHAHQSPQATRAQPAHRRLTAA